jgi:hypothetical protein
MDTETRVRQPVIIDESTSVVDGHLICGVERIPLVTITAVKYGWMPIQLDMFTIGSRYMLQVKNSKKELQVNFRSWLGIRKNYQYAKFSALMDAVWELTVVRLLNEMIDRIDTGNTVQVGKCNLSPEGILVKNFLIAWDDLAYQKNYNKLTLNSRSNQSVWTNLFYTETDNVHVLGCYLDYVFQAEPDEESRARHNGGNRE